MEKTKNIFQRMNDVMQKVKYIQKDAPGGLKYKVVSHDAVTKALHDAVTEAGILIVPKDQKVEAVGNMNYISIQIDFINMDEPTNFFSSTFTVPCTGIVDAKSWGGTFSYVMKYSMLKAFMLETGEDVDVMSKEEGDDAQKFIQANKAVPKGEFFDAPKSSMANHFIADGSGKMAPTNGSGRINR